MNEVDFKPRDGTVTALPAPGDIPRVYPRIRTSFTEVQAHPPRRPLRRVLAQPKPVVADPRIMAQRIK